MSKTYTVLVTDAAWPSLEIEREILAGAGAKLLVADPGDEAELLGLVSRADAILNNWRPISATLLEAAPRCLVVSRYGIGVDNIAVERATELGIVVANVPGFCVDEVSDHAMALLLACGRRLPALSEAVRRGEWTIEPARGMHRLRGLTLGLVGFGGIARAMVPKAAGFGLSVIAWTPRLDQTVLPDDVRAASSLDELLRASDFVSLHAPATPETRSLIGEPELRAMKPGAFLINTSRGALIDEEALVRAVVENRIGGAALDVLSIEPPPSDHPLLHLDRVLVTPHSAFYSEEAVAVVEQRAATNVAAVLSGRLPDSVVNREVLESPALRAAAGNTEARA